MHLIKLQQLGLFLTLSLAVYANAGTAIEQRIIDEALTPLFGPHRATTSTGKVIPEHRFDNAQVCGACHSDIYKEWNSSMMSHSWDDPIYRALLSRASKASNGDLDNFCTGCHTPTGLLTGQVTRADNQSPPELGNPVTDLPGVDCESCHNINAISGIDNGAYVLNDAGEQRIKYGPRRDAQSPYHETAYSPLHSESQMCATCHNVTHPLNGVPVERTYDEWYESPYRTAGVSCQDCHMKPVKGKSAIMGPERSDRATHWFAGGNTTLLEHFGHTDNAKRARALLQSSATIELVDPPQSIQPGALEKITLKVTNTGAGHKLPTGFPEGREVWVDMQLKDASGKTFYRSGAIKDGKTEPGTKNFMVRMGDKNGKKVEVEVWRITHIMSDNRILPKGHALVDYYVDIPDELQGPITLTAKLHYWPFSQAFADELLGQDKLKVKVETITDIKESIDVDSSTKIAVNAD
ncbi:multiheme c-type cytochrome [Gilvimarinus agarilyticus]|uniref:multiheme c-type cytochrome n=1 Tax=Gilvimarinus agarilyticus TaxID=679259 RepID=UPI00059FC377|nr:multiheme c-type cytochrome [Gilvimarinus agarilyticus]